MRIVDIFIKHAGYVGGFQSSYQFGGIGCAAEREELHEEAAVEKLRFSVTNSTSFSNI